MTNLHSPLTKAILHTTDKYIKSLADAGVATILDFIELFPRGIEDKSDLLSQFSRVNITEKQTIRCKIELLTSEYTRNKKQLIKAVLVDSDGNYSEAVWFNRKFLLQKFASGDEVIIFGLPKYEYGKLTFPNAEIEHFREKRKEIVPIYSDVNYISGTWIREKMENLKNYFSEITDEIPEKIREKKWFRSRRENIFAIHFPKDMADFERAKAELGYAELFHFQKKGIEKKYSLRSNSTGIAPNIPMDTELMKNLIDNLPFSLTNKQKIVIFQILKDMESDHAMSRMLQGDVGTGKTIVALLVAIHAILGMRKMGTEAQVAIMAPTEILARQHFLGNENWLFELGITADLLVGSLTAKQKNEAKNRLASGQTNIIFGTHALIQEGVKFANLVFVVVDEQHRFGVEQRKMLEEYTSKIPPVRGDENFEEIFRGDEKNWQSNENSEFFTEKSPLNPPLQGDLQEKNPHRQREQGGDFADFPENFEKNSKKTNLPYNPKLIDFSKENRKNMNDAEQIFWYQILKQEIFADFHFRKQKPIWEYIVDFYCSELQLIIEIDGESHLDQENYDKKRSEYFKKFWLTEIRFSNFDVINHTEWVFEKFLKIIEEKRKIPPKSPLTGGLARIPHTLNMSATPIPRSLALTLYGDQDISVLNEYPVGRKPIHTKVVRENQREEIYRFIEEEVQNGRQVYWISPLVEESETLDVASATQTFELLELVFPDFQIGLIHGKMSGKEKDAIMQDFYENKIQILSSTSVVEVGVNNPNATIICIEAAERFGLSQLHQFRGRVGRGEHQSYCYLFTTKEYKSERLRAMEATNDGFELAEIDLELRGPGEVYGVRQSGVPDMKFADLRDVDMIASVREDIENYLEGKL